MADLPGGIISTTLLGELFLAMAAVTVAASCVQVHPVMALPEGVAQEAILEMVDEVGMTLIPLEKTLRRVPAVAAAGVHHREQRHQSQYQTQF